MDSNPRTNTPSLAFRGHTPHRGDKTVGIIVQARLGSLRFPGKILKELFPGTSLLEFLLSRLKTCIHAQKLVVATTLSSQDDTLVNWLQGHSYDFFRGSEENCLERYIGVCQNFSLDIVVRITSDCPFVTPETVDQMIVYFLDNQTWIDYLSNRQYTNFPEGLDVEIFTTNTLKDACLQATLPEEREHVNYFFLSRASTYRIRYFNHNLGNDFSRFKLSIDTPANLERARSLFLERGLSQNFRLSELLSILTEQERKMHEN